MPLFFRFKDVNAAIFPAQRLSRHYFSGSTPLAPLFLRLLTASMDNYHRSYSPYTGKSSAIISTGAVPNDIWGRLETEETAKNGS